jgi:hypothetical protein
MILTHPLIRELRETAMRRSETGDEVRPSPRCLQVEAPENAAGRVKQDDIWLWLVDRPGIERDQVAPDPYCLQGSSSRKGILAALCAEV